jgi:zinc protease
MSAVRTTPPPPGPVRRAELPAAVERTLPNGLRVIAFEQRTGPKARGTPLIAAQLISTLGSAAEDEARAGAASLCAALLTHGTATLDATAFAQAVDALGARIDASAGADATVVSVSATTPAFAAAFALMRDAVFAPAFAAGEFERLRTKAIGDLALTYSNPSALARLVTNRVAYGGAPYGHPISGTKTTLAGLTREDIVAYANRTLRPERAILVIGGDIAVDAAFALAERTFGPWQPAPPSANGVRAGAPPPPRAHVTIVDKPDAGRTALIAGRLAVARTDPDFLPATVATAVLSGYSGRLNREIRVKRGLSYGAGAQLIARRDSGLFLASTLIDHTKVDEATTVVLETLEALAAGAPDAVELERRKATLIGGFYRGIETTDGIVGTLGEYALYSLPLRDLDDYVPHIEATSAEAVRAATAAYFAHDAFVVLVGNESIFGDAIRAAHPHVDVVPFSELDLASADLR